MIPTIRSIINNIMKLTCIILKVGYFFLAINLEIVVGIPSWQRLNSNDKVGNVKEYIDIAYVDILLAIIIFDNTDNNLAIKLIIIMLDNDFSKLVLI